MSSVASAIANLRDRIGAKHGGDPTPDQCLDALQEAEREVMILLPPEARPAKVKQSSSLTLTAASDIIAASGLPTDRAMIVGFERDGKPATLVDLKTMRVIQADKNSYWQGTDDDPYYSIGESGILVDPAGKTGNSTCYIDYLAVPSLTDSGDFSISDQFLPSVMDIAESVVLRRRGPEFYNASDAIYARGKARLQ